MASESDLISSLISIEMYLYRFGGPVLTGVGGLGCILNLIIFTRKNLRKNPCSVYMMAFSLANFLFIYVSVLLATLSLGYNVTSSMYNLNLCHFNIYVGVLYDILSPFYLILASVDRVLITSRNALTRRRSTRRLACISVISGTIFWMLFHCHILVFWKMIEIAPTYVLCYFDSNIYLQFISYYTIIVKIILVPVLMIVLGLRAIMNARSIGRGRVVPVVVTVATTEGNVLRSLRSKDRQLIKMLLIYISVFVIFNLMVNVVYVYQQITQYQAKSPVQSQLDNTLKSISVFSAFIPFCLGCYTNVMVSKTFRNEMKNLFLCR